MPSKSENFLAVSLSVKEVQKPLIKYEEGVVD